MLPRPDTDAATAVVQVAFALLKELGRARRRVLRRAQDDPEALHDYRVAIRRIRSVTAALRSIVLPPQAPRLERVLRRIARGTGPARDLEVLTAWVKQAGDRVRPDLGAVLEHELSRGRDRAEERLADVLRTRLHADVVDLFEEVFRRPEALLEGGPRPFGELARHAAAPLVARALDDADVLAHTPSMAALHGLRISLKRVRYALEAFAGGCSTGVLRTRHTLKRLQDHLGLVHDADVHAQWIVRAVVRAERRRLRSRMQDIDELEIAGLREVLVSLAPPGALVTDAQAMLSTLSVERARSARLAMRLLERRGRPALEALRTALEPPRPLAPRRVIPPPSPPAAAES